jgi:hypothetical protein
MHGSGSKSNSARATTALGALCPTLSHVSAAGGTAQMCEDWAFVSVVSPVSPNF